MNAVAYRFIRSVPIPSIRDISSTLLGVWFATDQTNLVILLRSEGCLDVLARFEDEVEDFVFVEVISVGARR